MSYLGGRGHLPPGARGRAAPPQVRPRDLHPGLRPRALRDIRVRRQKSLSAEALRALEKVTAGLSAARSARQVTEWTHEFAWTGAAVREGDPGAAASKRVGALKFKTLRTSPAKSCAVFDF